MCVVLFEVGPSQKLEATQARSLKCLGQPAQILLDSAVCVVYPVDIYIYMYIYKRRVQQVAAILI